jgi:hypothetical protein
MTALLLSIYWVLFGIKVTEILWITVGILAAWVVAVAVIFRSRNISVSSHVLWLIGFNVLLLLSSLWSQNILSSYRMILISFSGIIFFIIGQLLKDSLLFRKIFIRSILLASAWLALLWAASLYFGWGIETFGPDSLVTYSSYLKTHNHLGDMLMTASVILFISSPTLAFPLVVLIMMSLSRSSILGLVVGLGYVVYNRKLTQKYKKLITLGLGLFLIIFSIMSVGKSAIRSRDYYIQSLVGLIRYPIGVGYGDFGRISHDNSTHVLNAFGYSSNAHGLVFEWISGIGWFSLLPIFWLGVFAYALGKRSNNSSLELYRALWWAMLIPILLDSVYVNPSYWWLWMLVTGLAL